MAENADTLSLTAEIVSAYLAKNSARPDELADVIASVHQALSRLSGGSETGSSGVQKPTPAQIRKSIAPEHLISFEDGRPYKMLRRHLKRLGLTPESYRAKWGLPADYPMTAPAYAAKRAEFAKTIGLGRKRAPKA